MAIETGKWLINSKEDSLNYGRHYCSICRDYASSFDERNPKFEDNISEVCPHCGANLPIAELYRGKEVSTKNYFDNTYDIQKFKIAFEANMVKYKYEL